MKKILITSQELFLISKEKKNNNFYLKTYKEEKYV